MSQLAIQLPTSYGTLNCTVKRPTIGLNKRTRHASRQALEINRLFNGLVDQLGAAVNTLGNPPEGANVTELKSKCDDIQAQLDAQDVVMYNAVIEQAKLVLTPNGVTPNENTPAPASFGFDDVTWDDVDPALLDSVTTFFNTSIKG